jgi:excinuclease ABC subunit C
MELKLGIEETKEDQLFYAIHEIGQLLGPLASEVIVPFIPGLHFPNSQFHVPKRGDKLRLLEMSQKNAHAFRVEKVKSMEQIDPDRSLHRLMQTVQKDLRMNVYPLHIECFDNSNIQGTDPVAVCVVFKKGKPSKKDYRKFHIKTVTGIDDYASMQEVLLRRYSRLIGEDEPLPQLIVVDGGKGQLGVAVKVLEDLGLTPKIAVIALAERLEDLYFPGDPNPLFLHKNSPTLRLLMQMRDETHRFGISFHRNKRSKRQTDSLLRHISGIGPTREAKLYRRFKTIKGMIAASQEELAQEVGVAAARILKEQLTVQDRTRFRPTDDSA